MKSVDNHFNARSLDLINQAIKTGSTKDISNFISFIEGPIKVRIKRYINNKEDLEDILQKSLIKVFENYRSYDMTQLKPIDWIFCKYIYGQIKHYYRSVAKNNSKYYRVNEDVEYNDINVIFVDEEDPLKIMINKEKFKIVHQSIFSITNNNYQDVLILHNFAGIELLLIADWMNKKYSTIKTWNDRAKSKLAELLTKRL